MTTELDSLDRQRERWRRARERRRLEDPEAVDFGAVGLGRRVESPSVRVLVLPADPDAWAINFDESFWKWWRGDHPDPISNRPAGWGSYIKPSPDAAVRSTYIPDSGPWLNYIALHCSGAIELELGDDGAGDAFVPAGSGNRVRVFRLLTIVGRAVAALALYSRVREQFGVSGPTELCIGLQRTGSSLLGNLGAGWAEPWEGYGYVSTPQPEINLLLRRELLLWPKDDELAQLAMQIGDWLEYAWGSMSRRHIARQGPYAGKLDASGHQWRS